MKSAQRILRRCNDARTRVWQKDCQREILEQYYNSGRMPNDGCGRQQDSLGLGNRHMRRAHKQLRATHEYDGGPIEATIDKLDDFTQRQCIIDAFEGAANPLFHKYYKNFSSQIAGAYVVFGRATAWRPSKWDLQFRAGRPLVAEDATLDIQCDSFWWWAFPMTITFRDIDYFLENTHGGEQGWSKEGLLNLKRYILESSNKDRYSYSVETDLRKPFDDPDEILDCYAYFEKAEEKNGVDRKINMKIISRYTEISSIAEVDRIDDRTNRPVKSRSLNLKFEDVENERVIYQEDEAFDSIDECLILWLNDARISTENDFDDVQGDGDQFLARYLMMEEMMDSAVSGTSFAMQPHWIANQKVDKRVLQRMQETRMPKHSVLPPGVLPADKSNAINSSRAGLEIVQTLGLTIDEEASTGSLPSFGGRRAQTEFAAEAELLVNGAQEQQSLMFTFWHHGQDLLVTQFCRTLLRTKAWTKSDPSYHEVKHFHEEFKAKGDFKSLKLLESTKFKFVSRRLPGGNDKSTSLQRFMMILNRPDAPMHVVQYAWDKVIELLFGCDTAKELREPKVKPEDASQIEKAKRQSMESIVFGVGSPVEQGDDPKIHLQIHLLVLESTIQRVAQKGFREPEDTTAVKAQLEHISGDIDNLGGAGPKQQAVAVGRQLLEAFMQIGEQKPATDAELKQAQLQLKAREVDRQDAMAQSLIQNRERDADRKEKSLMADLIMRGKQIDQNDDQIALQKDKMAVEAAEKLLGAGT